MFTFICTEVYIYSIYFSVYLVLIRADSVVCCQMHYTEVYCISSIYSWRVTNSSAAATSPVLSVKD